MLINIGTERMAQGITNPFQERFGNLINEISAGMKGLEQRASLASQECRYRIIRFRER